MNLHLRLGAIILNLVFGVFSNLVYGLAVQFTSYARRLTVGVTDGLDAVAARVSSADDANNRSIKHLLVQSTRMHAFVSFPAVVVILLLAEPLLHLWVGHRVEDPGIAIPPAVMLIRVLAIGMAVRSVADGWARILYGAGHIRSYAPAFLLGGLASPILAVFLIWVLPGEWWGQTGPAWAFSIIMVGIHGVWFPRVVARCVEMTALEVIAPSFRSAIVAIGCAPVVVGISAIDKQWSLQWILVALIAYGSAYAAGAYLFIMHDEDRELVSRVFTRRARSLLRRAKS